MVEPSSHTAVPWFVSGPFVGPRLTPDSRIHIKVARVSGDETDDEHVANATFIVRACNNHYDLLAALEAAENALAEHCPGLTYLLDSVITPAISKARGEPA